jgi:hypothetical protein
MNISDLVIVFLELLFANSLVQRSSVSLEDAEQPQENKGRFLQDTLSKYLLLNSTDCLTIMMILNWPCPQNQIY